MPDPQVSPPTTPGQYPGIAIPQLPLDETGQPMAPVISPDGQPGHVRQSELTAATQAGYQPGHHMLSPDKQLGIVANSELPAAVKAGHQPISSQAQLNQILGSQGYKIDTEGLPGQQILNQDWSLPAIGRGLVSGAKNIVGGIGGIVKASAAAVRGDYSPLGEAVLTPNLNSYLAAKDASKKGDIAGVIQHGAEAAVPFMGPQFGHVADMSAQGKGPEAAVDLATQYTLPEVAGKGLGAVAGQVGKLAGKASEGIKEGTQTWNSIQAGGRGKVPVATQAGAAGEKTLYHGTPIENVPSITQEGLKIDPNSRIRSKSVHLTDSAEDAGKYANGTQYGKSTKPGAIVEIGVPSESMSNFDPHPAAGRENMVHPEEAKGSLYYTPGGKIPKEWIRRITDTEGNELYKRPGPTTIGQRQMPLTTSQTMPEGTPKLLAQQVEQTLQKTFTGKPLKDVQAAQQASAREVLADLSKENRAEGPRLQNEPPPVTEGTRTPEQPGGNFAQAREETTQQAAEYHKPLNDIKTPEAVKTAQELSADPDLARSLGSNSKALLKKAENVETKTTTQPTQPTPVPIHDIAKQTLAKLSGGGPPEQVAGNWAVARENTRAQANPLYDQLKNVQTPKAGAAAESILKDERLQRLLNTSSKDALKRISGGGVEEGTARELGYKTAAEAKQQFGEKTWNSIMDKAGVTDSVDQSFKATKEARSELAANLSGISDLGDRRLMQEALNKIDSATEAHMTPEELATKQKADQLWHKSYLQDNVYNSLKKMTASQASSAPKTLPSQSFNRLVSQMKEPYKGIPGNKSNLDVLFDTPGEKQAFLDTSDVLAHKEPKPLKPVTTTISTTPDLAFRDTNELRQSLARDLNNTSDTAGRLRIQQAINKLDNSIDKHLTPAQQIARQTGNKLLQRADIQNSIYRSLNQSLLGQNPSGPATIEAGSLNRLVNQLKEPQGGVPGGQSKLDLLFDNPADKKALIDLSDFLSKTQSSQVGIGGSLAKVGLMFKLLHPATGLPLIAGAYGLSKVLSRPGGAAAVLDAMRTPMNSPLLPKVISRVGQIAAGINTEDRTGTATPRDYPAPVAAMMDAKRGKISPQEAIAASQRLVGQNALKTRRLQ